MELCTSSTRRRVPQTARGDLVSDPCGVEEVTSRGGKLELFNMLDEGASKPGTELQKMVGSSELYVVSRYSTHRL